MIPSQYLSEVITSIPVIKIYFLIDYMSPLYCYSVCFLNIVSHYATESIEAVTL